MNIIILTAILILPLLYGILMAGLLLGWKRTKRKSKQKYLFQPSVSLIIPFRNEYHYLPGLIRNLAKQDYPSEKLEYVFVDDHSSDNGSELISSLSSDLPGKVILLESPQGNSGKKAALQHGVQSCQGEIILLTDADCQFNSKWISSMADAFSCKDVKMVQGPVLIHPVKSLAGNLQQIEFLSLMMSAAGSIGINRPILASGANLAVKRKVYLDGCRHLKDHINTGDDMFLLEHIKRQTRHAISYKAEREAIVSTSAVESFSQFWNQRKRWTAKSTKYQDSEILGTALLVLSFNMAIVLSLFIGLFNTSWLLISLSLLVFKTVAELPLIISGLQFYDLQKKLKWFLLTQIIYPFYVVFISLDGIFGNFTWKNRKSNRL